MLAYKGFEKGLICRGYQFIMGKNVTDQANCHIIPYWADKLGKTELVARQASPRGGTLYCRLEGDRVILAGRAALYARSELMLEDRL